MPSSFGEVWSDSVSRTLKRPTVTRASSLGKVPPTTYATTTPASQENSFQRFALPTIFNGRSHSASRSSTVPTPRRGDANGSGGSASADNASTVAGGSGGGGGRREQTKSRIQSKIPIAAVAYEGVVVASSRPDRNTSPVKFRTVQHAPRSVGKGDVSGGSPLPRSPTSASAGIASRDRVKPRVSSTSSAVMSDPQPSMTLPRQIPRATPVGPVSPVTAVKPSTAPPQAPAHRRATISTAVLSPSRPETRPQSFPMPARSMSKVSEDDGGEDEQQTFFRDPRLESTLSLIRSGQVFCEEQHILVDFVRRAKPTIDGRADMQPAGDVLRHALLLTSAALYLLEVEMLPHVQTPYSPNEAWGAGATMHHGNAGRVIAPGSKLTTSSTQPVVGEARSLSAGGVARQPGYPSRAAVATAVTIEKAKVKSIKMMDRLQPSELVRVSLPFKEVTLRNGDVVARKGCGLVLHTRIEGRQGHVWLKCRSNQDRGALVDALVPWYESNSSEEAELFVQQVPERPLSMRLARLEAPARGGVSPARRKDTDCILS